MSEQRPGPSGDPNLPRDAVPAHLSNRARTAAPGGTVATRVGTISIGHRPSIADHTQTLFFVAVIVSLACHAMLVLRYGDRPIGTFDPRLLYESRESLQARRMPEQDIVESKLPDDASQAVESAKQPDVADLSMALLQDVMASEDTTPVKPDPVELADVGDQRVMPPVVDPGGAPPPINLPPQVLSTLAVKLDLDVKFQGSLGSGGGTGGGTGSGGGLPGGSAEAERLLAGTGLIGGANPQAPSLDRPEFSDRRAQAVDVRVVQAPLATPTIDFADIALQGTTRIDIPEQLDADFDYVVTQHTPQVERRSSWFGSRTEVDDERNYFRVDILPKTTLRRLHTMPKDVVILIDISGSVQQTWVDQINRGVRDGLNSLNKGDRFNICFFSESPVFFNPDQIVPYTEESLSEAIQFLSDRKSKGMTDVNRALSRLLVRDLAVERVYDLILVSDGIPTRGVMDTRELINLITRDNDNVASIYCIGVSNRQNRSLLEFLAYRNKGYCVFVPDEFHVATAIRDLMSRLRYPIMKDVRLTSMGVDPEDVYPQHLPNLHQGERFVIFGRYDQPREFTMRLVGHNGRRVLDLTFTKDLKFAEPGDKQMAFDWAFWKLHHLYSEMIRHGQSERIKEDIEFLRRKYKLNTLY